MENNLEEGIMSFEDLMKEGNTLDIASEEQTTNQEETPTPEESAASTEEENETPAPVENEEEQEEEQEEEEQPEKVAEEAPKAVNSSLTSLAKKFLANGKWEDVVLDIDGEEIQLSELEEIDDETFSQIQEAQEGLKEESRKDKFIPKEGLNEVSLKLIELQKSGGNISEAIEVYKNFVNPLEGLDLNNERIQEQLVRRSLSKKVDDPEIIEMTIAKYKKDLVLDQKAQDVVDFTNSAFDKYVEQKTNEASTKKQQEAEAHKEYVKNLQEEYKTVDLKPEIKKQILQLANRNESGELEAVEQVREQLKDPKLAQELLFFISNRDAFKKSLGAKIKTENNITTMKKVNIVKDKQKKQTGGSNKGDGGSLGFDFIEVDKL